MRESYAAPIATMATNVMGTAHAVLCAQAWGEGAHVVINRDARDPVEADLLRFDSSKAQIKLVSWLRGRVFDVAVDVRRGSASYLHSVGVELSAENGCALLIPEGFAHGFQMLEAESQLLYLHSADYGSCAEGALHHADPAIGIVWPVPVMDISPRDAAHPLVEHGFEGIEL